MPSTICDGIETYYEVIGDGPPLLLFSPGGFNATIENWRSFGIYQRLGLLEHLSQRFTCITFDKRESGRSGGRVERLEWPAYARQGAALLDHLGVERAHVMGGCIGCSCVTAFAVTYPQRVERMVLYSPAGGAHHRLTQHARFDRHLDLVRGQGLAGVVERARSSDKTFAQDPWAGPWVSVVRNDPAFAADYARQDPERYAGLVEEMGRTLFDRDTVPGPEAQALMRVHAPALVVPGHDPSHATSGARYLEECLPQSEYWDVMPDEQTADNAPHRIVDFLEQ
jgi:pimeloyl-ACP methyl ester carboxylesterase